MNGTGSWDSEEIREPGAVTFDSTASQYIAAWSGLDSGSDTEIGIAMSSDGLSGWTPDAGNPITGMTEAEDPYIAKNDDGTIYRDASNRALMFTEEKASGSHRGIELWRSTAGTLTGWTLFGRVLDRGGVGTWSEDDVSSPTVIFDGSQLVMLYEGRGNGQTGQIGYAVSADDGETWTPDLDPIITQGSAETWNDTAIVPDDLILIDGTWVLLAHGSDGGPFRSGRYSTTATPATWHSGSFSEMVGNPLSDRTSVMCWGNDPTMAVQIVPTSLDVVGVYER